MGYHNDPRDWQQVIGTHTWFFIHSVAAKYPEHPSAADQQAMIDFVGFLGQLYPCKVCQLHLRQELRCPEINDPAIGNAHGCNETEGQCPPCYPPGEEGGGQFGMGKYGLAEAVKTREGLMMWLCRLHNIINRDLGKVEFECTPIGLDMIYLKNCGSCKVEKKGEGEGGDGPEDDHG